MNPDLLCEGMSAPLSADGSQLGCSRVLRARLKVRAGRAGLAGGRRAEPREPLHPDAATGSWAAPPSAPVAASPPRPRRALCSEPLLAPGSSSSAPNPATRR
ncbi:DNA excision repair protein ERCC-6-like 2 [Manis javanica]|nr:DNA excision repair protein ERCC-6-like 2 [Manis javanica]